MNLKPLFALPILLAPALCDAALTAPPISFSYAPDLSLPAPLAGATVNSGAYIYIRDFNATQVNLEWNPSPDTVTGYRIHVSEGLATSTAKFGADVIHPTVKVIYKVADLPTYPSKNICFRLRAFNTAGVSEFSSAVCTILSQIKAVSFYIDDPDQLNLPSAVDTTSPYSYHLPMIDMIDGAHQITTVVTFTDADPTVLTSTTDFSIVKKLLPPVAPEGLKVDRLITW